MSCGCEEVFNPQPGDLVAFDRDLYLHYALYIGKDELGVHQVINVWADAILATKAKIEVVPLDTVVNGSRIEVRNHDDYANKKGNWSPRSPEEILSAAMDNVKKNQEWPYEFVGRNCEYYCTMFRFGEGFSVQVDTGKELMAELLDRLKQSNLGTQAPATCPVPTNYI